jgi:hypothetical protein
MTDKNESGVKLNIKNPKIYSNETCEKGERKVSQLFANNKTGEIVTIEKWQPGTVVNMKQGEGGEEIFVWQGVCGIVLEFN